MKNGKFYIDKEHLIWAILIIIFIVAVVIVAPFIGAIISAYVLAFLLLPLFKIFNRRMGKTLSALLCIFILLILIVVPLFFVFNQVITEAAAIVENVNMTNANFSNSSGVLNMIQIENIQTQAVSTVSNWVGKAISSLPTLMLTLLVTIFGIFYFLYDWKDINIWLYKKIPFDDKKNLSEDIGKTTKRITYGLLLVGALEFTIAFIGFSISGVKFPLLLSLLIGLIAFTLVLDASVIWIPVAAVYFFILNDSGTALGVLITGLILSTDTFFRPKIMGSVSQINPFIMLIGVLGGISLFGILGFIIGPVVLFFTLRLIDQSFEVNGD